MDSCLYYQFTGNNSEFKARLIILALYRVREVKGHSVNARKHIGLLYDQCIDTQRFAVTAGICLENGIQILGR